MHSQKRLILQGVECEYIIIQYVMGGPNWIFIFGTLLYTGGLERH